MSGGAPAAGGGLRLLLVHRYFWPDTPPYAAMLRAIGRTLVEAGHDVTVLTCQPSYRRGVVGSAPRREVVDGVDVVRWPVLDDRRSTLRKVANLIGFSARLVRARRHFAQADVVMAASTPPVVVALVCSMLARSSGAQFIYHKQDVWPEVSGRGAGTSRVLRGLLRRVDHRTDRRAARVVVLSEDMARTVEKRGHLERTPVVLNNFDPWEVASDARERPSKRGIDIVFAGNLGRFQGLEAVAELVRTLSSEPLVRWHFVGDGPLVSTFEQLSREGAPVTMYGYRPPSFVAEMVSGTADLGLVSLGSGVIDAAYPSKTLTYLRQGCPILALVEQHSELATMVDEEAIGITGDPSATELVAARVRALAHDPGPLEAARARARVTYGQRFGADRQLAAWRDLVGELAVVG